MPAVARSSPIIAPEVRRIGQGRDANAPAVKRQTEEIGAQRNMMPEPALAAW